MNNKIKCCDLINLIKMVSDYKRTSDRESWDAVSMAEAIIDIVKKVARYKKISEGYGLPERTLKTRVTKY